MINQKSGDGNAGAEKHPGDDKSNNAERNPEAGTSCGGFFGGNRSSDCGSALEYGLRRERRGRNIGGFGEHHETVPFTRNRLDVKRLVRAITQDLSKLVHRRVDVGVVIHVRVGGPEALAQFFAGYDLTGLVEKSY